MLDWSFNKFECLPLLVSLLLDENTSKNEQALDALYDADKSIMSSNLWNSENKMFLNSILDAISVGDLFCEKNYTKSELSQSNFSNLFIEPVSFFRWAEKQDYKLTYSVEFNVKSREKELRIKHFDNYLISKEEVETLMREPLWFTSHAIMYLHGYRPSPYNHSSYNGGDSNNFIISSHREMKLIYQYLQDTYKLNQIKIYDNHGHKVKPTDFMIWAENLGLPFPNLILPKVKNLKKPLGTRERNTLYKMILGMAVKGDGYDPEASKSDVPKEIEGDLALLNINLTAETIREYLKKAYSEFPVSTERPES